MDPVERERIRVETEKSDNTIIIATYGTFQLGINIVNLHNIILAHPSKSKIRVLQSIGRVLRVGVEKLKAKVFDIADDLRLKKRKNYGIIHLEERIALFNAEGLNYDLKEVALD